jgi:threonyl-tRNA synthetase
MFSFDDAEAIPALCLKPMSCPCHVQVFNQRVRSYRELPIRYSEFGACHRDEPSGSREGLKRARAFVQDDAHVFCAHAHIEGGWCAFVRCCGTSMRIWAFRPSRWLATRPALRSGRDGTSDRVEDALANAARAAGLDFDVLEGEGAFYGPKLEFRLMDSRGLIRHPHSLALFAVSLRRRALAHTHITPSPATRSPTHRSH